MAIYQGIPSTGDTSTQYYKGALGIQNATAGGVGNKYTADTLNKMGDAGAKSVVDANLQGQLQDNQASNSSDLSAQNASQDLVANNQSGAFSVLNNLINQGYISEAQKNAALAQYGGLDSGIQNASNIATNIANNGMFTQSDLAPLAASYNASSAASQALADTGGFSPEVWAAMNGEFGNIRGRFNDVADRGGLTTEEYNNILTSNRQDVMDAGRSAAESLFNTPGGGGSRGAFGAQAIGAQTQANVGRQMAQDRADLDKYQADTRMSANEKLAALLDQQVGAFDTRADNQATGASQLGDLTGQVSDFTQAAGKSKLSGLDALNSILGIQADVAGDKANLETKTENDNTSKYSDVIQSLLGDITDTVNVESKTNKKGKKKNLKATTAFGDASSKKDKPKTTSFSMRAL